MRTSQLYNQDKNHSFTSMCCQRFDAIKSVSNKRTPTVKPLLVNPSMKNPKHAAVLADCGIQYDNPPAPIEVATRRAERIAKEKLKISVTAVSHRPTYITIDTRKSWIKKKRNSKTGPRFSSSYIKY